MPPEFRMDYLYMSFNRSIYDACAVRRHRLDNKEMFAYAMNPEKYHNYNDCRVGFGLLGGNNISMYKGSLVDLESELRNQTRALSRCPEKKFLPNRCGASGGLPPAIGKCQPDNHENLPTCKFSRR
ncbi:MAG: hypothetical protein ACYCOU_06710 [Sulfobacillus sp.]